MAAKILELETVQAGLRAQLEATAVDMTRLSNERDLLMELSNSLRADLTRLVPRAHSNLNSRPAETLTCNISEHSNPLYIC